MIVTFKPVDARTWKDFEALFEAKGGPKSCWCMVWRASAEESRRTDGPSRKRCIRERVDTGVPIGILGYVDREPVAWCSIAPKDTYKSLTGKLVTATVHVWSLVCFYVQRRHRNHKLTQQLIRAALLYAKENGAKSLEAYPVDVDSPSFRFMGHVSTFKAMGFRETGRAGTRRHIMVKDIGA